MLYKVMQALFRNDDLFSRYTPRPWHIIWAVFLLAVGTVSTGYGWIFFGVIVNLFGVIMGLTILIGMNWDKVIEYWDKIAQVSEALAKIKDAQTRYEILKSFGYKISPSQITITEREEDKQGNVVAGKFQKLPISPAIMQMMADKILMTGKMEFPAETSNTGKLIPQYRKVKQYLIKNQYIVPTNPKNVRLGYSFNKKGTEVLYEYASESVKLELRKKG